MARPFFLGANVATDAERNRGAGAYSTPGVDQKGDTAPAQIITSSPIATFAFKNLSPPSNLYITRDDRLFIQGITLRAGGDTIILNLRILRVDGVIVTSTFTLPLPNTAQALSQTQFLTEGFLLSAVATSANATVRGQTYCRVYLTRIGGLLSQAAYGLFADYVTQNSAAIWPGGRFIFPTEGPGNIRVIVGTTPAAGVDINEAVPAATRWRVMSFLYLLATSATVANRQSSVIVTTGVATPFQSRPNFLQAASTTAQYDYLPGVTFASDGVASPNSTVLVPFIPDNRLIFGESIKTSTLNIQAADAYSAPVYTVEEWIDLL